MKTAWAVAALGLAASGCVKQTVVGGRARVGPPAPSGVAATMRRQVINAAEAGQGDAIVQQLRARMAAEPANPAPRLALAAHYRKMGYPELEMEHLRVAVERFPVSRQAHMELAAALEGAGLPREAAGLLEGFVAANPASVDPDLFNRLGICYDQAEEWTAGESAFRRGLDLDPRSDHLLNNLGYNLLEQRRVAEAVWVLELAVRVNPRSETARNNLGLALAQQPGAAIAQALMHFENVTDAATAHSNLAAALIEQQRYQESRRLLEAALAYNRTHAAALANLDLLAALDGLPATLPARATPGPWRFPLSVLKWIFSPRPKPDAAPAPGPVAASKGDRP